MATHAIDWRTNYRAVFGVLSDPVALAWESYVAANVPDAGIGDIDAAVAELCDTWAAGERVKPSVKDVCKVIREQKLKARGFNLEKPFPVRQAEARIDRTPHDQSLARWNIVCEGIQWHEGRPNGGNWAAHLEAHALANGGLTVPYWAATTARRAVCFVLTRDTHVAGMDVETAALYARVAGLSVAALAEEKRYVDNQEESK